MSEMKEKIKNWLKDKNNLIFLGIFVLAIIIRFYYFILTKGQALWWDEADYLAYAKNLAGFPVEWIVTQQHNSLYPFIAGLIFKLGGGELIIKFLLQLIPSIFSVYLVFIIAKEMYSDKKIALIASFLMSIFWVSLFNTSRFHVDIPGLFFGLLAIYVFWKGYEKKENFFGKIDPRWSLLVAAFLVILTYTIRRGYFLFGAFFLIYIIFTRDIRELIKDKKNWFALVAVFVLFFLSEKLIFISKITGVSESYFHTENPINFLPLEVFGSYFANINSIFGSIVLYLFWLGLVFVVGNLLLSYGSIRKSSELKADLFNIITIFITLTFFIFVLRTQESFGEPRWYLPLAFSSFILIGRFSSWIVDRFDGNKKRIALGIIVISIAIFGFHQIQTSGNLINDKVNTFTGIRDASIYLKQVSEPNDSILTLGQPQVAYYSERNALNIKEWITGIDGDVAGFDETITKIRETSNLKYILISFSEPGYQDWARRINYINLGNQARVGSWEIPFMDTKIDFVSGEQNILQEKNFDGFKIKLLKIEQDIFIYEVVRN